MTLVGALITLLATLVLVIAALGVLRLPDALARQHAATKAATLGVVLFAMGLALIAIGEGWGWGWVVRLGLVVILLLLTLPLASHAVARAALSETMSDKANTLTEAQRSQRDYKPTPP